MLTELVTRPNESTDESGNNHYFIQEDGIDDRGPRQAGGEH